MKIFKSFFFINFLQFSFRVIRFFQSCFSEHEFIFVFFCFFSAIWLVTFLSYQPFRIPHYYPLSSFFLFLQKSFRAPNLVSVLFFFILFFQVQHYLKRFQNFFKRVSKFLVSKLFFSFKNLKIIKIFSAKFPEFFFSKLPVCLQTCKNLRNFSMLFLFVSTNVSTNTTTFPAMSQMVQAHTSVCVPK